MDLNGNWEVAEEKIGIIFAGAKRNKGAFGERSDRLNSHDNKNGKIFYTLNNILYEWFERNDKEMLKKLEKK